MKNELITKSSAHVEIKVTGITAQTMKTTHTCSAVYTTGENSVKYSTKMFLQKPSMTTVTTFSSSHDSLLHITTFEGYSASTISQLERTVTFSAKADIGIYTGENLRTSQ